MKPELSPTECSHDQHEEIVELAIRISRTVLSCGGETYRADECCHRILRAHGADDVEVISFPTGLFLTVRFKDEIFSRSASISDRSINLRMLDAYIGVSRGLTNGTLTPCKAKEILDAQDKKTLSTIKKILLATASATCFAVVFDGGLAEALCTLVAGLLGMTVYYLLDGVRIPRFISYFISAALVAIIAKLGVAVAGSLSISAVIVAGITPMLPGLAMTNAMRDSINGDIVSTSARAVEAVMIAVGIAAGVGVVLILL